MPELTFQGSYTCMNGWMWFQDNMDMVEEGWKLHVSSDANHAQVILDSVLPVLQEGMIVHKFLPTTEDVEKQSGEQCGKFIAVYPPSIVLAFMIVSEIDKVLTGVVNKSSVPIIMGEKYVGRTVIYTRYGAYNDKLFHQGKYVNDTRGQVSPDWIQNPWGLYSTTPDFRELSKYPIWPRHGSFTGRKGK